MSTASTNNTEPLFPGNTVRVASKMSCFYKECGFVQGPSPGDPEEFVLVDLTACIPSGRPRYKHPRRFNVAELDLEV